MSKRRRKVEEPAAASSPALLPACLYGSTDSTRAAWKDLLANAWRAGTWDVIRDHLELVPASAHPGPIVVWNNDRLIDVPIAKADATWYTTESVWQLNWILEVFPAPYDELVRECERHYAFVLEGMRDFWFCVGLLEGERRFLPFLSHWLPFDRDSPEELRARILRPFVRAFVHWLPDLMMLDHGIASASAITGVKIVGVVNRLDIFADLLHIDRKVDQRGLLELFTKRRPEEVVAFFVEHYG